MPQSEGLCLVKQSVHGKRTLSHCKFESTRRLSCISCSTRLPTETSTVPLCSSITTDSECADEAHTLMLVEFILPNEIVSRASAIPQIPCCSRIAMYPPH